MSKPKKLSAMDLLVKSDAFKPAISQHSAQSRSPVANLRDGAPVEISPEACRPWKLADRPESETLHKEDLIKSFGQNGIGQIQPIVVRNAKDADAPDIQYEVICGRVRWLAAKELGIPVQAIVRELDDREAYAVMSAENRQRKNLSDYAKSRSYRQALAMGVFDTAQALAEAEGISKSRISQYLGFADLPEAVVAGFTNIAKLPYRMGYELNKACKALGVDAVIALIPKIESGELSRDAIQHMQTQALGTAESDAQEAQSAMVQTESAEANSSETADILENAADLAASSTTAAGEGEAVQRLADFSKAQPAAVPEPQLKKRVVSSSGHKLFTYNQASRGWLIRIAPDISQRMDETLMLEIGKLLETFLDGRRE